MSLCLCWFVCCLLDLMWLWVSGRTSQFLALYCFCWLVTVLNCYVLCNVLRGNDNFCQQRKFSGAGINFLCSFTSEFSDWHLTAPLYFCFVQSAPYLFIYHTWEITTAGNIQLEASPLLGIYSPWNTEHQFCMVSVITHAAAQQKETLRRLECKSWLMSEENGCHVNIDYNALKQRSCQVRFLLSVSSCFQSSLDAMLTISWQSSCARCKHESGINLSHLIPIITRITIFH